MNYLTRNAPPTREERLKSCHAFGGTACGLVDGSKKGCLGGANRGFSQSTGCQLMLSMAIAGTVPDAAIVFHGPVGCGSCLLSMAGLSKINQASRGNRGNIGQHWYSTNLSEAEVVGGGEAKLEATIREVDRRGEPEVIWVASTCVPGVIGDDVDAVVQRVQKEVRAKILPLHCPGFKTKIVATAYDVVYHSILRYIVTDDSQVKLPTFANEEDRRSYEERRKRTVNLLNVASMSRPDEEELVRLLSAIGLHVNILPCFAPASQFIRARDAALSVSICATHDDYFVEHLKELYGIPYILNTIPIGSVQVKRWLLEIADFFQLRSEAERVIAAEEAALRKALEPIRARLAGKRVFVSAGEIRAGAQAIMLETDLGMQVVAVRAHHYDQYGDVLFEALSGETPVNVAASQPFEQVNLLKRLKPDIYVGHLGGNVWTAKLGIPVLPIFGPLNSYMGYRGTYEVSTRLDRVLRNPRYYQTLGTTAKLPFRDSWYQSDPFKYIRTNAAPRPDREEAPKRGVAREDASVLPQSVG